MSAAQRAAPTILVVSHLQSLQRRGARLTGIREGEQNRSDGNHFEEGGNSAEPTEDDVRALFIYSHTRFAGCSSRTGGCLSRGVALPSGSGFSPPAVHLESDRVNLRCIWRGVLREPL